ncbi:phosphoglycerate kinase [Mycoplasma parvum]|uniref:Phosphoglycerate kinase n=1 Tax=Mycoplasma parvum str. Indiana TaxID=1403316 RepID=U5NBC6_9MOLU|nr:phosphoglycerate kinase [Mycoplasma parvum]AGX88841.1 phosphoglycerate kinase [Mycoplasma parvum str. Indiana]
MRFSKLTLRDLALDNKRVVLRLDLNVPIKDGKILNNTRLLGAVETIQYLLDKKCQIVILSHFDRVKSYDDITSGKKSLKLVADEFKKMFSNNKVVFVDDVHFAAVKKIIDNEKADIYVLENTRYYDVDHDSKEITKLESGKSPVLSQFYADLGDVFVNDAFGTSHRAHASNVGVAERLKDTAIGLLVEKELKALDYVSECKEGKKVMILGGSKASDKLKLIKEIINHVDALIIGGGMSYTFLKSQGKNIGLSLLEQDQISQCAEILNKYSDKIYLPVDHIVSDKFEDKPGRLVEDDVEDWGTGMALDIGPKTIQLFHRVLEDASIIIWNGPLGVFEMSNYSRGTFAILDKLVELTQNKNVYTLVGGGDSVSAVETRKVADKLSFVSTGGGATLTFLEKGNLPGIEVIRDKLS